MINLFCHVVTICTAASLSFAAATAEPVNPTYYSVEIQNTYPHDTKAFTQGLFFHDGHLYESTGKHHASGLRKVELETGKVLSIAPFEGKYFGEGSALWGDTIISLTWRAGTGFVHSLSGLERLSTFTYPGEGWGLTASDTHLIMSDGTNKLRFLDPETLEETSRLSVTIRGKALSQLNELEWINGEIFANVWQTDYIVRIDPTTGHVTGVINLTGLLPASDRVRGYTDVLNGIAYDPATERLFVTGKYWPKLFEVKLVPN